MKTIILAAAAALTLGIGSAYAGDGEGPVANTQFTEIPNVIAQAQVPKASAVAANQSRSGTALFVTHQQTVHVFGWNPNEGVGG